MPGAITVLRPLLPKVPAFCKAKAAGLYQRDGVGVSGYGLTPVASGRSNSPPAPERSVLPIVIVCGNPVCTVQINPVCHPPAIAFKNPFCTSTFRPLPIGSSHKEEA